MRVLIRDKKDPQRHTQKKGDGKMETETGVSVCKPRGTKDCLQAQKLGERHGTVPPSEPLEETKP